MYGWGDFTDESECSSVEYEEEVNTSMQFQSGRIEVGGKDNDGTGSLRVEIEYNFPFYNVPVVFVCPEGEIGADYNDVFGACVIEESISKEGFACNVGRFTKGEIDGWGQALQLNWIAVDSTSPLLQATVYDVGPKETSNDECESVECQVRFPMPFPRGCKPAIFATVYGNDNEDCFSACVQYSATKKATLNVCRSNGYGWKQDLRIAVLATTLFPTQNYVVGMGNEDMCQGTPELAHPGGNEMKRRPIIFTMGLHEQGSRYPDSFVCSPINVTTESYQINLLRNNLEQNGWGQDMRIQCIMIP